MKTDQFGKLESSIQENKMVNAIFFMIMEIKKGLEVLTMVKSMVNGFATSQMEKFIVKDYILMEN
jgi:hypothetical protein